MTGSRLPLALVSHRYHLERAQAGLHRALAETFDLTTVAVEDGWPERWSDLATPDATACLFFVRFRELAAHPPFDWEGFAGIRAMYDFDINANYHNLAGTHHGALPLRGAWPPVVRAHRFDLVLTTGGRVRDALEDDGIAAEWLPKAYDHERLADRGGPRHGVCTFGQTYLSRAAVLHRLGRAGVAVERFSCPYDELDDHLNRYAGALVCNLGAELRPGPWWRVVHRLVPSAGVTLGPGFEPMIKNFEVAGAGCAPICDRLEDLDALGFVDGETMVGWSDVDELVDVLRHHADRPDELVAVGRRAAAFVAANHTWAHRARRLEAILRERT
jgi:hypothetical protein